MKTDDPRISAANAAPLRPERGHVLYWMTAARRTSHNRALARAIAWARELARPLVVLEPLRLDYPWASERLHAFVVDGMRDNQASLRAAGVAYLPYVEPTRGAGAGLVAALGRRACVVVADDYPCFFLPRALAAAAAALDVRLERVDGNGLLPVRAAGRAFPTAHAFRRHLQASVLARPPELSAPDPLAAARDLPAWGGPGEDLARWTFELPRDLAALAIDHKVLPVGRGGPLAGRARLDRLVADLLPRYAETRHLLEEGATSGLAPYLHFGHVGAEEVFAAIVAAERWTPERIARRRPDGDKDGFWGMSVGAEALLDQVITWRELGLGWCAHRDDYASYESIPAWAQATLADHAADPRPALYSPEQLEAAATHDPLWNAAQTQLVRAGTIAGYLRMLWGKKVIEWSPTPRAALEVLIHLNNKYALDGRDPNTYTNILWLFGRHDRAWGPKRPVFGTVRYMSSDNTARKLKIREYLARWGPRRPPRPAAPGLFDAM